MPILPALVNHEKGLKSMAPYFSSLRTLCHRSSHTKHSSDNARSKENHLTGPLSPDGFHGTTKDSLELAYIDVLPNEPGVVV